MMSCPYCGSTNIKEETCGCSQCADEPWVHWRKNSVCQDCDMVIKSCHE